MLYVFAIHIDARNTAHLLTECTNKLCVSNTSDRVVRVEQSWKGDD